MAYLAEMDVETGFVSPELDRDKGSELREAYVGATPFPHIVIDDFLPPQTLEMCLREFPSGVGERLYNRAQERLKTQFNPDVLSPNTRTLFYSFNSLPFIRVLENITGISGLVPDPYFLGAGFHEIKQGGHLSVHADFNHHKPMNLERRINVLIYLNKSWSKDWGGDLELWDDKMSRCVRAVTPEFNRCVIFNTTSDSYHGNPQPICHPEGISRKSIALYYYTSTWSDTIREHTTQFRARPGTAERPDWLVRRNELIKDLTPPMLARVLGRLKRRRPRKQEKA